MSSQPVSGSHIRPDIDIHCVSPRLVPVPVSAIYCCFLPLSLSLYTPALSTESVYLHESQQPLRIQKLSTPTNSPPKAKMADRQMGDRQMPLIPRALTELAPTEKRRNSPSFPGNNGERRDKVRYMILML